MKRFSEDRYRTFLLFSSVSTRKTPDRVQERRSKILNLLNCLQREVIGDRIPFDNLQDFDNQLKQISDI